MPVSDPVPDTAPAPSSLSSRSVPSSFDGTEFFEESRLQKLWRRIREEPLIPVGCAATCYALYQAAKSIREGNPVRTNKMFRARIYAQGFTLACIVVGGIYYKDDRMRRRAFEEKLEEKKRSEKKEKWLKELEARDREDREWRANIERQTQEAEKGLRRVSEQTKQVVEANFPSKSMREQERRDWWVAKTKKAWRRM